MTPNYTSRSRHFFYGVTSLLVSASYVQYSIMIVYYKVTVCILASRNLIFFYMFVQVFFSAHSVHPSIVYPKLSDAATSRGGGGDRSRRLPSISSDVFAAVGQVIPGSRSTDQASAPSSMPGLRGCTPGPRGFWNIPRTYFVNGGFALSSFDPNSKITNYITFFWTVGNRTTTRHPVDEIKINLNLSYAKSGLREDRWHE